MLNVHIERTIYGVIKSAKVIDFDSADKWMENRNDWKSFDAAAAVAKALGENFIATDAGPNVSPRYDVTQLPKVGDKVSGAFNGDSYPEGKVVSISKSLRLITTDTGKKFYRIHKSGSWRANGTWFLRAGHVYEQNPSF